MFEGALGKKMMIEQGYVPRTCTLNEQVAGPTIWYEINAGRSPCWAAMQIDKSVVVNLGGKTHDIRRS